MAAPNNKIFTEPLQGKYHLEHRAFGKISESFVVDVNLDRWIIEKSDKFPGGKSFSGHAAVYTGVNGTDSNGDFIEVYDQWTPDQIICHQRADFCPHV